MEIGNLEDLNLKIDTPNSRRQPGVPFRGQSTVSLFILL